MDSWIGVDHQACCQQRHDAKGYRSKANRSRPPASRARSEHSRRGLAMSPLTAMWIVHARRCQSRCASAAAPRITNSFVAAGGTGFFGAGLFHHVAARHRCSFERVSILTLEQRCLRHQRLRQGYLYGRLRMGRRHILADFCEKGVFSCYRPVPRHRVTEQARPFPGVTGPHCSNSRTR